MFYLAGNILPYIISLVFIWGIFLINTSIGVIAEKDQPPGKTTESGISFRQNIAENHVIILSAFGQNQADKISDRHFSVFTDIGLKIPVFDTPPGEIFLAGNKMLRSPPVSL